MNKPIKTVNTYTSHKASSMCTNDCITKTGISPITDPHTSVGLRDILLSRAYTNQRLLVKLYTKYLELTLRQLATSYDLGQLPEQHFALCVEGVEGLTKKCYGTYIDKEYIDKVLGNRTITIFAGTCAATLLACEAATKLLAGAVLGAIRSGSGLRYPRSHSHSS